MLFLLVPVIPILIELSSLKKISTSVSTFLFSFNSFLKVALGMPGLQKILSKFFKFKSLLYLLILLFPFLSFISTNLLGRYIGVYGSRILSTLSIFLSFMLSLLAFYESALSGSVCSFILLS